MTVSIMPSGISSLLPYKIEGFVIKCPTFLISINDNPDNFIRPFLVLKLLLLLSFRTTFFPFFSKVSSRSPFIRPSQFL